MGDNCDILVLGSTGMLGSTMLRYFQSCGRYKVLGTSRQVAVPEGLKSLSDVILRGVEVEYPDILENILDKYRPTIVINCVGLVKQLDSSFDPLRALAINSIFPHRLNYLCQKIGARLILISTDCVFDGELGMYTEDDWPNALDLYGRSKLLGEVNNSNAITLRTSIIGHEVGKPHSLLEWFLGQTSEIKGFRKAIFSGLPTIELSRVIHDIVIPKHELNGLYHVSSKPINKFDLLSLIAIQYQKEISIIPDDDLTIDRSLNSSKFAFEAGFKANSWPDMISEMCKFG
jgi:dTDP-4-dehydrorhamnose reductase